MRAAREALKLSQARIAEENGYSVRTYQKNEGGLNEPGICLAAAFMRAGVNANWLLLEKGPMLLAELDEGDRVAQLTAERDALQARLAQVEGRLAKAQGSPINQPALRAIIAGTVEAQAPGAPADVIARLAVDYYCRAITDGMITADGIGEGSLKKAG